MTKKLEDLLNMASAKDVNVDNDEDKKEIIPQPEEQPKPEHTPEDIQRAIAKADKIDEALDWLRNNNHGDLIKNTVSIDYARGEDNAAEKMKQDLRTQGQSFTDKTGVHPQTLKAFVREQTESGKNLPLDLLGAHIGQKTIIKEV